jgi:hypothetical protein
MLQFGLSERAGPATPQAYVWVEPLTSGADV